MDCKAYAERKVQEFSISDLAAVEAAAEGYVKRWGPSYMDIGVRMDQAVARCTRDVKCCQVLIAKGLVSTTQSREADELEDNKHLLIAANAELAWWGLVSTIMVWLAIDV